jgi:protein CpxP
MRKINLAVLGTAALALALGAGAVGAQMPGPEGPGGSRSRTGRAEGMARFLGLSEAQKVEVRKLMEGRRAEHEALREQLEAKSEALEKALESASPVPAEVGELAIEGHRLREQGQALRAAQDKAVRALLTPEQQTKFDAMKALRHGEGARGPRP